MAEPTTPTTFQAWWSGTNPHADRSRGEQLTQFLHGEDEGVNEDVENVCHDAFDAGREAFRAEALAVRDAWTGLKPPSKEQLAALRERLLESYLRQAWNSLSPDGVPLDSCVVNEAALTALLDDYDLRGKALEAAGCPNCCDACESATGGVCRRHQQPECTCYEALGGHQPGCPMGRIDRSASGVTTTGIPEEDRHGDTD